MSAKARAARLDTVRGVVGTVGTPLSGRTPSEAADVAVSTFSQWSAGYSGADRAKWPLWILGAKLVRASFRENVSPGVDDLAGCDSLRHLLRFYSDLVGDTDATMVLSLFGKFPRPLLDREALGSVLSGLEFDSHDAEALHDALFSEPVPESPAETLGGGDFRAAWTRAAARILRGPEPEFQSATAFEKIVGGIYSKYGAESPFVIDPARSLAFNTYHRCNALRRLGHLLRLVQSGRNFDRNLRTLVFNAHYFLDKALTHALVADPSASTEEAERAMCDFLDTATRFSAGRATFSEFDAAFSPLVGSFASCYSELSPDEGIPGDSIEWCLRSSFGFRRDGTFGNGAVTGPVIDQKMALFFDGGLPGKTMCTAGLLLYIATRKRGRLAGVLSAYAETLAVFGAPCLAGQASGATGTDRLIELLYEAVSVHLCVPELAVFHEHIALRWIDGIGARVNPDSGDVFVSRSGRVPRGVSIGVDRRVATAAGLGKSRARGERYDWASSLATGAEIPGTHSDFDLLDLVATSALPAVNFFAAVLYAVHLLCLWLKRLFLLLSSDIAEPIRRNAFVEWIATSMGVGLVSGYTMIVLSTAVSASAAFVSGPAYATVAGVSCVTGAVAVGYRRRQGRDGNYREVVKFLRARESSKILRLGAYTHIGVRLTIGLTAIKDKIMALFEAGDDGERKIYTVMQVFAEQFPLFTKDAENVQTVVSISDGDVVVNNGVYVLNSAAYWVCVSSLIHVGGLAIELMPNGGRWGTVKKWSRGVLGFTARNPHLAQLAASGFVEVVKMWKNGLSFEAFSESFIGRAWRIVSKGENEMKKITRMEEDTARLVGGYNETGTAVTILNALNTTENVLSVPGNVVGIEGNDANWFVASVLAGVTGVVFFGGATASGAAAGISSAVRGGVLASAFPSFYSWGKVFFESYVSEEVNENLDKQLDDKFDAFTKNQETYTKKNGLFMMLLRQLSTSYPLMMQDFATLTGALSTTLAEIGWSGGPLGQLITRSSRQMKICGVAVDITTFLFWACGIPEASMTVERTIVRADKKYRDSVNKLWNAEDFFSAYQTLEVMFGNGLGRLQGLMREFGAGDFFGNVFSLVYSVISVFDALFPNILGNVYDVDTIFEDIYSHKTQQLEAYAENVSIQICEYPRSRPVYTNLNAIMKHYRTAAGSLRDVVSAIWPRSVDDKITALYAGIYQWIELLWTNLCVSRYCSADVMDKDLPAKENMRNSLIKVLAERLSFAHDVCFYANIEEVDNSNNNLTPFQVRARELANLPAVFSPLRSETKTKGGAELKRGRGINTVIDCGNELINGKVPVHMLFSVLFVRFVEYWILYANSERFIGRGARRYPTLLDISSDMRTRNVDVIQDHKTILLNVFGRRVIDIPRGLATEDLFKGYETLANSIDSSLELLFKPERLRTGLEADPTGVFSQFVAGTYPCTDYEEDMETPIGVFDVVPTAPSGSFIQIICASEFQKDSMLKDVVDLKNPFYVFAYMVYCHLTHAEAIRMQNETLSEPISDPLTTVNKNLNSTWSGRTVNVDIAISETRRRIQNDRTLLLAPVIDRVGLAAVAGLAASSGMGLRVALVTYLLRINSEAFSGESPADFFYSLTFNAGLAGGALATLLVMWKKATDKSGGDEDKKWSILCWEISRAAAQGFGAGLGAGLMYETSMLGDDKREEKAEVVNGFSTSLRLVLALPPLFPG